VPSNLGAEVCAFANATGGVILISVSDDGDVVGVGSHNRLKSQVQTTARSADPPIAVEVESVGGVLVVTVPEQHSKPYSFSGRFYVREGSNCQQMSRDEIRESFYKEGLIRFDETPCPRFDLQRDLTPEAWSRFAARARIPDELEPLFALENLHLVRDRQMTHAGAWLLAEDITKYSLQAAVTCALLRGVTKTHILDLKNFTGDLYSVYEDCVAYAQAKLNTALIPHIHGRDERLELPEDAIREALVNAIAHRDYRSTANVQMYLFHDRLEIVTPGGLPAAVGSGAFARSATTTVSQSR
jgi:ATP-dependent DNA helicase RecG